MAEMDKKEEKHDHDVEIEKLRDQLMEKDREIGELKATAVSQKGLNYAAMNRYFETRQG